MVEFIPNVTGSILFTSATLFELPSVTKSTPTDIIMIIGISKLHNQITKLVSLECKFYANVTSLTLLAHAHINSKGEDIYNRVTFSNMILNDLNCLSTDDPWSVYLVTEVVYGDKTASHKRDLITFVKRSRRSVLTSKKHDQEEEEDNFTMINSVICGECTRIFSNAIIDGSFAVQTNVKVISWILWCLDINENSIVFDIGCGMPLWGSCCSFLSKKTTVCTDLCGVIEPLIEKCKSLQFKLAEHEKNLSLIKKN